MYVNDDGSKSISKDGVTTVVDPTGSSTVTTFESDGFPSIIDGSAMDIAIRQMDAASSDAVPRMEVLVDGADCRIMADALDLLSNLDGYILRIVSSSASLEFGSEALSGYAGDLRDVASDDGTAIDRFEGRILGGRAISIDADMGFLSVHILGDDATIKLSYAPGCALEGFEICVWYVDGDRLEMVEGVGYDESIMSCPSPQAISLHGSSVRRSRRVRYPISVKNRGTTIGLPVAMQKGSEALQEGFDGFMNRVIVPSAIFVIQSRSSNIQTRLPYRTTLRLQARYGEILLSLTRRHSSSFSGD